MRDKALKVVCRRTGMYAAHRMDSSSTRAAVGATAFTRWLRGRQRAVGWRLALMAISVCWWLVLATYLLSDRPWHPYWWTYLEDVAVVARAVPEISATLFGVLAAAIFWPWVLPANGLAPPPGWRSWVAGAALVCLVPQAGLALFWYSMPTLEPARTTVAGQPTRPVLWIIAESADVGVHLPRVDARRHDYFGVVAAWGVPPGAVAGVWAQICGLQLDAFWAGPPSACLIDRHWRVIFGQTGRGELKDLLASTNALVIGGEDFPAHIPRDGERVGDAELMQAALMPHKLRHHVLVLTGDTSYPVDRDDQVASDAAMGAAIGEWLDRGGVALVTANRPRPLDGWRALPVRLFGVDRIALPEQRNEALELGKAAPGRLMGGLPTGSLYDTGCTAWSLAGFGCRRLGHGVSLTHDRSKTLGPFRSVPSSLSEPGGTR